MFQLVYSSTAVRRLDRDELTCLVERARSHNGDHGITGMLLCSEGRFLQLLEGEEDEVRQLYAAICADARHRDVTTLSETRRLRRQFPTWTMAFRDLGEDPIIEPGYAALFEDAVERVPWAVDALVSRLRPSRPAGRPVIHSSRVLGLLSG